VKTPTRLSGRGRVGFVRYKENSARKAAFLEVKSKKEEVMKAWAPARLFTSSFFLLPSYLILEGL
jgi:hypothetical protein